VPLQQAGEQLQAQQQALQPLHVGCGAGQQHRRAQIPGAAQQRQRLIGHGGPFGFDGGDDRIAELLLGLALGGRLQRDEGGIVFQIVAARRVLADRGEQSLD